MEHQREASSDGSDVMPTPLQDEMSTSCRRGREDAEVASTAAIEKNVSIENISIEKNVSDESDRQSVRSARTMPTESIPNPPKRRKIIEVDEDIVTPVGTKSAYIDKFVLLGGICIRVVMKIIKENRTRIFSFLSQSSTKAMMPVVWFLCTIFLCQVWYQLGHKDAFSWLPLLLSILSTRILLGYLNRPGFLGTDQLPAESRD